jgi:hypothetical protein
VKEDDALLISTLQVFVPFTLTEAVTAEMEDALAIVLNTPLPDAVTLPQYVPDKVTLIPAVAENAQVFVPSEL